MNVWKKITRWGSHIENAPKMTLLRVLVLFFSSSLLLGAFISWGVRVYQAYAYEKIVQDIRTTEYSRMDARLETLGKTGISPLLK